MNQIFDYLSKNIKAMVQHWQDCFFWRQRWHECHQLGHIDAGTQRQREREHSTESHCFWSIVGQCHVSEETDRSGSGGVGDGKCSEEGLILLLQLLRSIHTHDCEQTSHSLEKEITMKAQCCFWQGQRQHNKEMGLNIMKPKPNTKYCTQGKLIEIIGWSRQECLRYHYMK